MKGGSEGRDWRWKWKECGMGFAYIELARLRCLANTREWKLSSRDRSTVDLEMLKAQPFLVIEATPFD